MNKGNSSAIFGGLAGVVTIGALAFTSAAGSTTGALTPAAGGLAGSTPTSTISAQAETPLPNASDDGKMPNASDDGKPTATATAPVEPKPTEAPEPTTTPEPTKAPKPPVEDDKFDLPPGAPSVSDNWQEGYTMSAYPGYCTAAQSMEHLRSSTVRVTVPALEGVKAYQVRIEGAGKGTQATFPAVPGKSFDSGAFPLQWTGTNDSFSIVLYADEEGTGTKRELARLSSKTGSDFAHKASRWCDGKPVNDAPKPPKGHGTPGGLPTGPIIQAG